MSYGKSYPHIHATIAACGIVALGGLYAPDAQPHTPHDGGGPTGSGEWRGTALFVSNFQRCAEGIIGAAHGPEGAPDPREVQARIKHLCTGCPATGADTYHRSGSKCDEFDRLW